MINANIKYFFMVLTSLRISFTQLISADEYECLSCVTMLYWAGQKIFWIHD